MARGPDLLNAENAAHKLETTVLLALNGLQFMRDLEVPCIGGPRYRIGRFVVRHLGSRLIAARTGVTAVK